MSALSTLLPFLHVTFHQLSPSRGNALNHRFGCYFLFWIPNRWTMAEHHGMTDKRQKCEFLWKTSSKHLPTTTWVALSHCPLVQKGLTLRPPKQKADCGLFFHCFLFLAPLFGCCFFAFFWGCFSDSAILDMTQVSNKAKIIAESFYLRSAIRAAIYLLSFNWWSLN